MLGYGDSNKCRWNPALDSLLYVKYSGKKLNVLDVEKGTFLHQRDFELTDGRNTCLLFLALIFYLSLIFSLFVVD